MSKIHELLDSNEAILVFDVDGVLAKLEYGEYTHYNMNDIEWAKAINEGKNYYTDELAFEFFKRYFKSKNMNNIYVITKAFNENEGNQKKDFVNRNYGIKKENVYITQSNHEKLEVLIKIKEKLNVSVEKNIVMIDDTVEVLNHIMDNSNFSTVHVSSFID